jgi:arylsulfatase A-like enzyme
MKENKMNVLFFITDQHRADMLHCYGNSNIKTPNLDKLASEGVRFTNAYCTNPMCMPNRVTLLTGYYPNVHGVRSNGINLNQEIPTITQTLKKRGYHTINVGKTHYNFWIKTDPHEPSAELFDDWRIKDPKGDHLAHDNFPMPYYGFDEMYSVIGHGCLCLGDYLDWLEERAPELAKRIRKEFMDIDNFFTMFCDSFIPEELYNTTYIQNQTIKFLERYSKGDYGTKPFFLHCSFPDPHHPVCPPGRYRNMYSPDDIDLPDTYDEVESLYSHPYLGTHMKTPPFRGALLRESTEEEIRKFIAMNYGSVSMVDNAIGHILASLEKLGLSENTMVIFTSDHGDYMGDHGLLFKGPSPYNGTLQVPLIWKVPNVSGSGVSDALISSVDIPRTILELLGIRERYRPSGMQGYDMTPILKDPSKDVRKNILIVEDEEVGPIITRVIHLVTKDYKLTKYAELENYGDLFDRKNDKDEKNNLWDKEKELKYKLMEELFHEYLITRSRFPIRKGAT